MPGELRVAIQGEDGIVAARQQARALAKELGFGVVDQSRITTAVSELARNVVRYATNSSGEMLARPLTGASDGDRDGQRGVEIIVSDGGPGIADVALALSEGYTSGGGLGMGLPGTRRLVDEMEIDSGPGQSTVVTIRKWRR